MTSVFRKHIADSLEKERRERPPTNLKYQPAGRLLNWLTNYWTEPTISLKQICWRGPVEARKRKSAIDLAETLAQRGFLIPVRGYEHRSKVWKIVRETK